MNLYFWHPKMLKHFHFIILFLNMIMFNKSSKFWEWNLISFTVVDKLRGRSKTFLKIFFFLHHIKNKLLSILYLAIMFTGTIGHKENANTYIGWKSYKMSNSNIHPLFSSPREMTNAAFSGTSPYLRENSFPLKPSEQVVSSCSICVSRPPIWTRFFRHSSKKRVKKTGCQQSFNN